MHSGLWLNRAAMEVGDPGRGRKASKDIPMDRKMNEEVSR